MKTVGFQDIKELRTFTKEIEIEIDADNKVKLQTSHGYEIRVLFLDYKNLR